MFYDYFNVQNRISEVCPFFKFGPACINCYKNFDVNISTRLFYKVWNFAKPYDFVSISTIHCSRNHNE